MRIAVLSDVHANLEALEAVLADADAAGVEQTYVLGDIVGYNADPEQVVKRLAQRPGCSLLAGNHDLAATRRFDTTWFNSVAAAAIDWTREQLSEDTYGLLEGLQPRREADAALLVHGSVVDPAAEYVTNTERAAASFKAERFRLCLFGHTHLPTVFRLDDGNVEGRVLDEGQPVTLGDDARYMLNPGSVGQPRDGDPRASYMIVDTDQDLAVIRRVAYDIATTQVKIVEAGLPRVLADRLGEGR